MVSPSGVSPVFIHMLRESCRSSGVRPYSPTASVKVSVQLVWVSKPNMISIMAPLQRGASKSVTQVSGIAVTTIMGRNRGGALHTKWPSRARMPWRRMMPTDMYSL